MRQVGVDGCKGGWVSVALRDGAFDGAAFHPSFQHVLDTYPDAGVIAVDIPIGPSETGHREADVEARRFLRGQASSVFSTPPREALLHDTYELASAAARAASGRGLSKQSFALRMRIVEVDAHALRDPRIWEVHPEVSFRELAGEPIPNTKKSWHGQMRRRAVLEKAGILLPADLGSANAVAPDDVLDAAVAAWSADRIANGQARSLPHPPEEYPDARMVAIWY